MKYNRTHHTAAVTLILLTMAMLSGCVHRQFVSEPYPRWGEESIINRLDDSPPLIVRVMLPPDPANAPACVLLVHGMNEHIGRYGEIAHYFSRRFIVAGFDLYAHGLSNPILQQADQALSAGATKQDVSDAYFAQISLRDLEPMRQGLDQALRRTIALCDEQNESERPVFIISHSLGSLIAASYLLQIRNEDDPAMRVQGIVLLGPAFSVSEPPGWHGWLANPLIKLSFHAEKHFLNPQDEPLPLLMLNQLLSLVTVPLLDGLFEVLSWPGLRSIFTPVAPDWVVDYLTDSAEEKARFRADGWIIHRSLLRYVKGIEEEIVHFRQHMDGFTIPYYLIYSGHDPITPAWGSEDFAHATLNKHFDNELLPLPNLSHHQHLFSKEPLRHEFLRNIEQWLDRRLLYIDRQKTNHSGQYQLKNQFRCNQ